VLDYGGPAVHTKQPAELAVAEPGRAIARMLCVGLHALYTPQRRLDRYTIRHPKTESDRKIGQRCFFYIAVSYNNSSSVYRTF